MNAAGISHYSVLTRLTPADIHDVLDTNLYGTTIGCRAAMRAWIKNRHVDRCIVNISSLLALRGGYGAAAYAASKAGVIGLTRAVAGEGSTRRVRANVILPGYIESSMTASKFFSSFFPAAELRNWGLYSINAPHLLRKGGPVSPYSSLLLPMVSPFLAPPFP